MAIDQAQHIPGPLAGAPIGFFEPFPQPLEPVLFPVFDDSGSPPELAYQIGDGGSAQDINVKGAGLQNIVSAAFVDIQVGGNSGDPPGIAAVVVDALQVKIETIGGATQSDDLWGIRLTDSSGTEYAPPSAVHIYT